MISNPNLQAFTIYEAVLGVLGLVVLGLAALAGHRDRACRKAVAAYGPAQSPAALPDTSLDEGEYEVTFPKPVTVQARKLAGASR